MKKTFLSILPLLAALTVGAQQPLVDFIAENPDRAAGVLHVYETFDTSVTPPPAGFEPFYIAHYGRHGSRYHTSTSFFEKPVAKFEKAASEGILTADGQKLFSVIRRLGEEHEGMKGFLTQVGAKQHQGIAERMVNAYPQVFYHADRPVIHAVSSTSERCIQSMANFCTVVKGLSPQLDVQYITGTKYMSYICHPFDIKYMHDRKHEICDSILHEDFKYERLYEKTFTDPKKGREIFGSRYYFKSIFDALAIAQDLDADVEPLLRTYFTTEELAACNRSDNARYFATWCISEEFGDKYVQGVGGPLLRDFIEKADAAIAGNDHAADLRFGHDSGLTPLLALIGVEGFKVRHEGPAGEVWPVGKYMCMASNLQMVFFHDRAGHVLVKLLRNESETTIPGLETVTGPYYLWETLREYLVSRIK
ncbi:MAG: hypothetical protein IJ799_01205 [Bacteroidales bacterium]|nr:hypothetical protein [Bacteroidales bacterium]